MKTFLSGMEYCLDEDIDEKVFMAIKDIVAENIKRGEDSEFVFEHEKVNHFIKLCLMAILKVRNDRPNHKIIITKLMYQQNVESNPRRVSFFFNGQRRNFEADKVVVVGAKTKIIIYNSEVFIRAALPASRWAYKNCESILAYSYPELFADANKMIRLFRGTKKKNVISLSSNDTEKKIINQIEKLPIAESTILKYKAAGMSGKEIAELTGYTERRIHQVAINATRSIWLSLGEGSRIDSDDFLL